MKTGIISSITMLMLLFWNDDIRGQENSVPVWDRFEVVLESSTAYENPLYEVPEFYALFTSPGGRTHKINGFWDGGTVWRIRFMPEEKGAWEYTTFCSDTLNGGLHHQSGTFRCTENDSPLELYRHGSIRTVPGSYYLSHADGTPFFWQGCTAWNGGLKSRAVEWEHYLQQRAGHGYNVIQLVGTQWRGCDTNGRGEVAFTGSGRISLNPSFFQYFDMKMDRINAHGHVAALVLLWALPVGEGMELSPGYYLPGKEAILLARYMVARYGAHHVAWVLGGDGKYYGELECRWRHIGREVFRDNPQGPATLHPHGRSWVGEIYRDEPWYDIDGYQSTHNTSVRNVRFINHTIGEGWKKLSPRPVINMEPCYEEIRQRITDDDVRQASYWSIFAAPPAGITYGANGIWPWIREGEKPLNHYHPEKVSTWDESIEFPGSRQIGYLGEMIRSLRWWDMVPAQELLLEQPGEEDYKRHISVLKSRDHTLILAYLPGPGRVELLTGPGKTYSGRWFDPVNNRYEKAALTRDGRKVNAVNPFEEDAVLILSE